MGRDFLLIYNSLEKHQSSGGTLPTEVFFSSYALQHGFNLNADIRGLSNEILLVSQT